MFQCNEYEYEYEYEYDDDETRTDKEICDIRWTERDSVQFSVFYVVNKR